LAALLGKKLLQKNGNLETQLKKLEDFAEETFISNQDLSNQLAGCKDALKLANKSCESLEIKLEEIEVENKELKIKLSKKESALIVKTKTVDDLHYQLKLIEDELTSYKSSSECSGPQCSPSPVHYKKDNDLLELKQLVCDLKVQLENSTYQKSKIQQTLDKFTSDNAGLIKTIERNEVEILELQNHIASLEEYLADRSLPATPNRIQSPKSICTSPVKSNGRHFSNDFTDDDSILTTPMKHLPEESKSNGLPLFAELQAEYNTLQNRFDTFLSNCSCRANLPYKASQPPFTLKVLNKTDTSLRVLFQEVYDTLKQTSAVADKLIERQRVL
jgi:DNA repair exonuclease SbcCD ATPase subunit